MLAEKINQLTNTSIYNKIKNFLLSDNHFMNFFWIINAFILMSFISLPTILSFTLLIVSVKALNNASIVYTKNLIKFWCFNFIVYEVYNCMTYFIGKNIFTKIIEFVSLYFLLNYSYEWFTSANMENNTSIQFIESTLAQVKKLYQVNYLSLDFITNFIVFISQKYHLLSNYFGLFTQYFSRKVEKETHEEEAREESREESHGEEAREESYDEVDNETTGSFTQKLDNPVKELLPISDDSDTDSDDNDDNDDKILEEALKELCRDKTIDDIDDEFIIKRN
jgi:hypothetical protein